MSLFSFLRKNKQESASDDRAFYSSAEEDSKTGRERGKRKQSGKSGRGAEQADPVLPEKKRARRRLIGAVALVLAAVIGLPMILDSEPKPLADDIAIQIPSKDKVAPVHSISPGETDASRATASASLEPREELVEPDDAPATKPTAAKASSPQPKEVSRQASVQAPPVTQSVAEAVPEPRRHVEAAKTPVEQPHTPAAAPSQETKPAAAAKVNADETARALALLNGRADPKDDKKDSEKYVIQVAALATKEKVNELQARLKAAGIASYTQRIATASGQATRIRVGPFSSREEAEKARAKIVKLGLNGTLVPV